MQAASSPPSGAQPGPEALDTSPVAPVLEVRGLSMRFGDRLIQEQVSFTVQARTIFAIMGVSGCGKSTLLRHMIGLLAPAGGQVLYSGTDYWASDGAKRNQLRAGCGMLFQSAALWSSMTIRDNIGLPLAQVPAFGRAKRDARVAEVLGWVGLEKFADFYPADLSGGMKKRAGLARAIAASPHLLLLDEPSSGLDPISSRRFDELIVDIRQRTDAAVIVVSHELPSLLAIADDGIFLDADSRRPIAHGSPRQLLDNCDHPTVHAFMRRDDVVPAAGAAPIEEPRP